MVISVLFDPGADAAQALGREEEVGRKVFQGDALQQLGIFAQHAAVLFAFAAPGVDDAAAAGIDGLLLVQRI